MKKNYLMIGLLAFLSLWLTACTTEEESALDGIVNPDDPMLDISNDVLKGKLFLYTELSVLQERGKTGKILDTREPVELIVHNDYGVPLYLEERDGLQYVRAGITNAAVGRRIVIPAYVKGKESGEIRNMIFIIENNGDKDNLEEDESSLADDEARLKYLYASFLGRGVTCFNKLGEQKCEILLSSELYNTSDKALIFSNRHNKQAEFSEIEESSFSSLSEKMCANVGLGGKAKGFSMGLNYGKSSSKEETHDREFYMLTYKVKCAEMKINTANLEKLANGDEKKATEFLSLVTNTFNEGVIETPHSKFSSGSIYDEYGTDMIVQGTLGGSYSMLYSREENIYENTIKHDFSASFSRKEKPDSATEAKWYKYLAAQNSSPNLKTDISVSYEQGNYFKSTKSTTEIISHGGSANVSDPYKWAEVFDDNSHCDQWTIIQYNIGSDNNSKEEWCLYNLDKMAKNVITAVETIFNSYKKMSEADKKVLANARANMQALIDGRDVYLDQNRVTEKEDSPLVICDVKMINSKDRRKNGKPVPFVDQDPMNSDEYRTYYPLITNQFFDPRQGAKEMRGKPVDTNDNVFISSGHTSSHYWYVAFAHADDCNGITDIKFCNEGDEPDFYIKRGDHARNGLSGMLVKKKYVYVKFAEKPEKRDSKQTARLITAFGLYDSHKDYKVRYKGEREDSINIRRIFASSFGADIPAVYIEDDVSKFFNFWQHGYTVDTVKNNRFYQGGGVTPHHLYPVYSTHPIDSLPKNRIFTKWGQANPGKNK